MSRLFTGVSDKVYKKIDEFDYVAQEQNRLK